MSKAMKQWFAKFLGGALLSAVAVAGFASSAQAAMSVNLRLADGTTSRVLTAADIGTTIPIQVWASVTTDGGNNGTGSNEGLHFVTFSILSEVVNGGLNGGLVNPVVQAPFDGQGHQKGNLADLNADGIIDLGSLAPSSNANVARARAASAIWDDQLFGGTGQAIAGGFEFLVETVDFEVTSANLGSATKLNAVIPGWVAGAVKGANWWQNSTKQSSNGLNNAAYSAGTSVTLSVVPEPGSLVLGSLGLFGLIGLAIRSRNRRA